MKENKKRVLVALSGGVDSSVSAALLQEAGYEVEGAFIVTWTAPWLPCTWKEERRDAMRVAAHLGIPFHTIDLSKEYEHDVVQYLVDEYKKGRTPNPDVMCNKYIKFGGLFDWAMQAGFDYIATGHYAQSVYNKDTGLYELHAGLDTNKDQSYFLWTLTQKHLAHTLFPVGALAKPAVRTLAETHALPTAQKKDSQGVCFLGKINMKEFLQHYLPPQPGIVLDTHGKTIGSQDGAMFVTLGQRHGFSIAQQSPHTPPLYIVAKDVTANTITVAPRDEIFENEQGDTQTIHLQQTHWISDTSPSPETHTLHARLRYRQKLFPVTCDITKEHTHIHPHAPQSYIPSGQSLVLYKGDVCLGGGIITEP